MRIRGRALTVALLAVAIALTAAGTASATTRFAAPGGTATAAQCTTPVNPCTISEAATGTGVVAADEVVVAPGNYSDTAGDLGVDGFVSPIAGSVHGAAGLPRPKIVLNNDSAFGAIAVFSGVTVSYLAVDSAVSTRGIFVGGGVVDGLIARAPGGAAACLHQNGTIRNTACISTGANGTGVGVSVASAGALAGKLRNVTAIATGSGSYGASYRISNGGNLTVSAKAVIARGAAGDVRASGQSPSTTTITIDHSNFAVTDTSLGGGTITDAGSNQSAAPLLASDNVHQLSGSPTINAGAVDGDSGTTDVDGQMRTLDTTPDIGADEFGHTTTTSLVCLPASVQTGSPVTCTATVTDTASGATTPTGNVSFSSDAAGGSFSSGTCALVMINSDQASCQVTYTPGQVGSGNHLITGSYVGDSTHEPSQGSTSVAVTAHPTSTAVFCAPASVLFGSPTTCTAIVTDTAASGKTTPTGSVSFDTDSTGDFSPSGTCTLVTLNSTQAGCQRTYTPDQVGTGTHQVSGGYSGDSTHAVSQGSTPVTVGKHATTTSISCLPDSLTLGAGSSTCTATVTDTAGSPATPTGTVGFATNGAGTFSGGGACTLAMVSASEADCQLTYTPTAVGTGTHEITGSYAGSSDHNSSQSSTQVGVGAAPPSGGGSQPVPALCAGKQVTIAGLRATISGSAGNDTIVGTRAADVIDGAGGNDNIRGLGGNDTICGDQGKDTLIGGAGNDKLLGGAGKDILKGGKGKDKLKGGAGKDKQIQ